VACDVGNAEVERSYGADLQVLEVSPRPGEGGECAPDSPADCGVPINAPLVLRFNRHLLPATAVRQSLRVYTGSPNNFVFLEPHYDVIERVVVYRLPAEAMLEPGALYTVELLSPRAAEDFGFQAYDGAPLTEGPVPLKFGFFTAKAEDPPPLADLEPVPSCEAIVAIFARAGCQLGSCHTGAANNQPKMGLNLFGIDAFRTTALGHVAHQTEIGARLDTPLENPVRFGVQMPIVDASGDPANSYLFYKLLRNPDNFGPAEPCDPASPDKALDLQGVCRELSSAEAACLHDPCGSCYSLSAEPVGCLPLEPEEDRALREWFVRGEPMPIETTFESGLSSQPLSKLDLRRLQRWMAAGAACP
jgi:hypothetical protein